LESLSVGGWEEWEGGGAGGGYEDEHFVVAKVDAVGMAKFVETL
jgi:hypothetical protein